MSEFVKDLLARFSALRKAKPKDVTVKQFLGFHTLRAEPTDSGFFRGSVEIFHLDAEQIAQDYTAHNPHDATDNEALEPGFYWWSCFPGCLPEDEPHGPFETAELAYIAATEG